VREDLCRKAYGLLTGGDVDYVSRQQMMGIFLILNDDCDEVDSIPQEEAELLFAVLDKDGSEKLEIDEFILFGQVMLLEFEEFSKYGSSVEKYFPRVLESPTYIIIKDMVNSRGFDGAVDFLVMLNAFVVLLQCYPMLAGESANADPQLADGLISTQWEVVETIFTLLFVSEMASKVAVFGWNRYATSMRNLFDGLITVAAAVATFYVYYPGIEGNKDLLRFIIMARVFRILRFFISIKQFKQLGHAFFGILPAAGRVSLLLFSVVYIWSWIGMYFFGGLITRDPNNPTSKLLNGTDFAGAFYWANNFNDMLSGANVCFNLLVINNWNVMESGIVAVAQTKVSRFFFFTFYIMGVMIVNNLVIALVIDYYLDELENGDEEEICDVFGSGRELVFDSDDLPTSKKFGKYVARLRPKYRLTAMTSKRMLKKLFSQRVRGHHT